MYRYIWDSETGGLLLTTETTVQGYSNEPRPVYYRELDILGFDRYWRYPKDDSAPIMWAESNNYIYKGRTVARTKGGSVYTAPEIIVLSEPEPEGEMLKPVNIDLMTEKNRALLETLSKHYRTTNSLYYSVTHAWNSRIHIKLLHKLKNYVTKMAFAFIVRNQIFHLSGHGKFLAHHQQQIVGVVVCTKLLHKSIF